MLNIPILARSFLVFSPGWTRLATTPLNKNKQAEPKKTNIYTLKMLNLLESSKHHKKINCTNIMKRPNCQILNERLILFKNKIFMDEFTNC
jgi:hypothetical protein